MKTPSIIRQTLLAVIAAAICSMTFQARASTIFWGSEFNDLLFDSNGVALDTSYSFEIGSFGAFVPTYQNVDLWTANWKVFDRAFDPDANGWNAADQFFVGTVDHNALGGSDSPDANPADVFAQGEVAYLWVYNSKDIVPTSEWALVMDGSSIGNLGNQWIFPDPADPPGTSYNWQLSDADTSIIGGVQSVRGAGDYTVDPGTYSLQTAVVPEPGSSLLLMIAAGVWAVARRRDRAVV